MRIDYYNMANGDTRFKFAIRYILNKLRTWWYFHVKWPWVHYNGYKIRK